MSLANPSSSHPLLPFLSMLDRIFRFFASGISLIFSLSAKTNLLQLEAAFCDFKFFYNGNPN